MQEVTMCCTTCPTGCALKVEIDDENRVAKVTGNSCPRGEAFAQREWTDPVRTLTGTVLGTLGEKEILIPVRTKEPIPKTRLKAAMEEIREARVDHPVQMGNVIIPDIAGTGVDLVACRTIA